MSALTDRLLAEVRKEFNLLAVAHDDLIAAPTTTANLADAVGDRERDVVTALLRALAGETLDAAAREFADAPEADVALARPPVRSAEALREWRVTVAYTVLHRAAPLLRAPLLVQVAELADAYKASNAAMLSEADRANRAEAQLTAAREALEAIANLPTPRAEMDGNKKVGDPNAFAYNYQHIARAALTGATQQEGDR